MKERVHNIECDLDEDCMCLKEEIVCPTCGESRHEQSFTVIRNGVVERTPVCAQCLYQLELEKNPKKRKRRTLCR